jgi:hypothetical protein
MTDVRNYMVRNPANRFCVSDGAGLVPNPDGSIDIYIQNTIPAGHEANWLPAPSGHSSSGCGCICLARQFFMANTTSRRSSR